MELFQILDSSCNKILSSVEQKFEALDEGTKQTFINDARNLCQRWYALTGGKELNLVSDVN